MIVRNFSYLFLLSIMSFLAACNQSSKPKPIVIKQKEAVAVISVDEEVSKLLFKKITAIHAADTLVIKKDSLFATSFVSKIYAQHRFSALWTSNGKPSTLCDTLLTVIGGAGIDGLIPSNYHFFKIKALLTPDSITHKNTNDNLADADLLLTDAFFAFIVHLSAGRFNTDSLTLAWRPEKLGANLVSVLNQVLKSNNIKQSLYAFEPKNIPYQQLKQALQSFLIEFKTSNWDTLTLLPSDSPVFMDQLKKRLIASHDYFNEYEGSPSAKMIKAIKNFQCQHSLTEDGKIGKQTFIALQKTKADYIHQLEMNMERWRWQNPPKEEQYIWINIPKYELRLMVDDTLVFKSRVIVGQPDHPTPILKSLITNFLIYPYWNVPFKIATDELLPILKRDTSYLRRKNFDVLNAFNQVVDYTVIKWNLYNDTIFPWRLRQRMGDDNSLGILKFNFKNKYGVYLHDTDSRWLFNKEMRALSHGCIRLEKFIYLADYLIRDDSARYPKDSLKYDLLQEKQKYIYLRKPITIYTNYFTAEVDEWGNLFLLNDIYGYDKKMLNALNKK
ncbi:MAG: L,D-transpeptidase family protein [Bacteroidia bacterium]